MTAAQVFAMMLRYIHDGIEGIIISRRELAKCVFLLIASFAHVGYAFAHSSVGGVASWANAWGIRLSAHFLILLPSVFLNLRQYHEIVHSTVCRPPDAGCSALGELHVGKPSGAMGIQTVPASADVEMHTVPDAQ